MPAIVTKKCSACGDVKPLDEFHKQVANRDGRARICKLCSRAYAKEYYQAHRERYSALGKSWQAKNRESINARYRRYTEERKQTILKAYGGKCACCGESNPKFLTIDHVNGGGHQHRQRAGSRVYAEIIRLGFPADYQILCFNCNCAKGIYGECPHKAAVQ